MKKIDIARASISATLREIEQAHAMLALPADPFDVGEAIELVHRIERRLASTFLEKKNGCAVNLR